MSSPEVDEVVTEETGELPIAKMSLEVAVQGDSACEKHLAVTISRDDIERYFSEAFSELMPTATVPGFRPGRAPRKLVEQRFRSAVKDQVKGKLIMECVQQVVEDQSFSPISEPDLDIDAIEIPNEGPMTFEFRLEVRPEFETPQWKGLKINKPVLDFSDEEVDRHIKTKLREHAQLTPFDGPASPGDFVVCNITFSKSDSDAAVSAAGDDGAMANIDELTLQLKPKLSFRDGNLAGFDQLMAGACEGDAKTAEIQMTSNVAREDLRGAKVRAEFEVLDVKRLELPKLTPEFLHSVDLEGIETEEQLREAIRENLTMQAEYRQNQAIRQQIVAQLIASANWELPPDLLEKQTEREIERAVLELQSSGFSNAAIRAKANELRQNSLARTEVALKEHFILEKIAEEQKVDAAPEEFDAEMEALAKQQKTSVRRYRARLEKKGMMDSLRNHIIEKKVLSNIVEHAEINEVPFQSESDEIEAIDIAIAGGRAKIPEAKHGEEDALPQVADRT